MTINTKNVGSNLVLSNKIGENVLTPSWARRTFIQRGHQADVVDAVVEAAVEAAGGLDFEDEGVCKKIDTFLFMFVEEAEALFDGTGFQDFGNELLEAVNLPAEQELPSLEEIRDDARRCARYEARTGSTTASAWEHKPAVDGAIIEVFAAVTAQFEREMLDSAAGRAAARGFGRLAESEYAKALKGDAVGYRAKARLMAAMQTAMAWHAARDAAQARSQRAVARNAPYAAMRRAARDERIAKKGAPGVLDTYSAAKDGIVGASRVADVVGDPALHAELRDALSTVKSLIETFNDAGHGQAKAKVFGGEDAAFDVDVDS